MFIIVSDKIMEWRWICMKEKAKSTPRRSPGEASYRKRADGSWEGRITINYKPYSVYGKSRG
jgi:hypothetical protein